MTKYSQIANDIRRKIINGDYSSNQQLPVESEIGKVYDASKLTVKKALDILVSEGLVIKRRGSGTFVKTLSNQEMDKITVGNQMRGTTAFSPEKEVSSIILDFQVVAASKDVSQQLAISEDSFVYSIYRVRLLDGKPAVIENTFMPVEAIPGLNRQHLEGSIYEFIEDGLGLKIQSAHRIITVRKVTDFEAEQLILEKGDPVAVAEQIGYLDTGIPFEFSVSVHRYDEFAVKTILTKS